MLRRRDLDPAVLLGKLEYRNPGSLVSLIPGKVKIDVTVTMETIAWNYWVNKWDDLVKSHQCYNNMFVKEKTQ